MVSHKNILINGVGMMNEKGWKSSKHIPDYQNYKGFGEIDRQVKQNLFYENI